MAALGFDLFRLAYFWEGLEPAPGQLSSRYLDDIARVESSDLQIGTIAPAAARASAFTCLG